MSFNIISFLKASDRRSLPVAEDNPLPVTSSGIGGGITYTDKTITSATGASQTLAAANASRKSILIKNGAANAGVNITGGTAAIGGAGTITLAAYEFFALTGADCPVGEITVITTAGNYVSAFEGT